MLHLFSKEMSSKRSPDCNNIGSNSKRIHTINSEVHQQAPEDNLQQNDQIIALNKALLEAVKIGNLTIVQELLKAGANVYAKNPEHEKETLIHLAIKNGDISVVKELLNHGSKDDLLQMDFKGGDADTPLHYACKYKNLEMVKLLLANGASRNVEMISSAFYYASKRSVFKNGRLMIEELIKHGAMIDFELPNGDRVINYPWIWEVTKVLKYVIEHGSFSPKLKKTRLHYAAEYGLLKLVKKFLKEGDDPSAKDCLRQTPYDIAKDRYEYHDHTDDEDEDDEDNEFDREEREKYKKVMLYFANYEYIANEEENDDEDNEDDSDDDHVIDDDKHDDDGNLKESDDYDSDEDDDDSGDNADDDNDSEDNVDDEENEYHDED